MAWTRRPLSKGPKIYFHADSVAKRIFDFTIALLGLLVLWPLLLIAMLAVWLQDFANPFYVAPRARRKNQSFNMLKLRSMVCDADRRGGASTSSNDNRITWIGRIIRKTKFDEVPQLWNVLVGDMSLVGPRPQVMRDVAFYTEEEYHLFDVRPGITDFASIVFSDEGDILKGSANPDLKYNQLIRPWKSRLGLLYVRHNYFWIDLQLILLTLVAIFSKPRALSGVRSLLRHLGAPNDLIRVAERREPLIPHPPPGAYTVETRW
jgi:lipopolysaccharide/colanic/teichoic acid biosynthesis glycosyltransferase